MVVQHLGGIFISTILFLTPAMFTQINTKVYGIGLFLLSGLFYSQPYAQPHAQPHSIPQTAEIDFSKPETFEQFPGGQATHKKKHDINAFSHHSANLSRAKQLDFKIGNAVFRRLWVSAPASTQAADGLGPLFNARSCERCHLRDGRGHPPTQDGNDNNISLFLRLSIPAQSEEDKQKLAKHLQTVIPEPTYGSQLQDFSIQGHQAEGKMTIQYQEKQIKLSDGEVVSLRAPQYQITQLGYGPLHPQTQISPRIAPQMIGLGLLEAIDQQEILKVADPDDANGDGISGKPNWVWSLEFNRVALGRFGWKAGSPSVNEQSQAAFSGDMGISTPLFPQGAGECTLRQSHCLKAPDGNSPQFENLESGLTMTDLTVFYSQNLAVPARPHFNQPKILRGKKLFYDIGCTGCHRPKYLTPKATPENGLGAEQSEQLIWPYTDLLLHDMGEGLADHRPEGEANGREWRTPPLWGLGLIPIVNQHSFYLHDGRARNLLEAILWHGGEAKAQQQKVIGLNRNQREDLLAFIRSL